MKESPILFNRPILFSGPMVNALLAGTKTQTRRIVKMPMPPWATIDSLVHAVNAEKKSGIALFKDGRPSKTFCCPYGQAGDRLWVKETWKAKSLGGDPGSKAYALPGSGVWIDYAAGPYSINFSKPDWCSLKPSFRRGKWNPSIFMPRWASRITLEISEVRVERLRDISEADAYAEGLTVLTKDGGRTFKYGIPDRDGWPGEDNDGWHWHEWNADPREAYFRLWAKINGEESLAANPWVWAISFKSVQP